MDYAFMPAYTQLEMVIGAQGSLVTWGVGVTWGVESCGARSHVPAMLPAPTPPRAVSKSQARRPTQ